MCGTLRHDGYIFHSHIHNHQWHKSFWIIEFTLESPPIAKAMQILAILTEHQDLAFVTISNAKCFPESSANVYVHWFLELAWSIAMGAKWLDKVQVGVKHLYSAIVPVTYIDLMVMVSDTPWFTKLSNIFPLLPNWLDHLTTSVQFLHFVISTGYIHIAIIICGNASGPSIFIKWWFMTLQSKLSAPEHQAQHSVSSLPMFRGLIRQPGTSAQLRCAAGLK